MKTSEIYIFCNYNRNTYFLNAAKNERVYYKLFFSIIDDGIYREKKKSIYIYIYKRGVRLA
jgi:hypothetical protein